MILDEGGATNARVKLAATYKDEMVARKKWPNFVFVVCLVATLLVSYSF